VLAQPFHVDITDVGKANPGSITTDINVATMVAIILTCLEHHVGTTTKQRNWRLEQDLLPMPVVVLIRDHASEVATCQRRI